MIDASSQDAVIERLRRQGHVPIRAELQKGFSLRGLSGGGRARGRIKTRDLGLMTRELATLLDAGLQLDRGLSILAELSPAGPVRTMIEQVLESVRGGSTFADALEQHEQSFPGFYIGLVRAGEAGGNLAAVLNRLSDTLDKSQKLKESVRTASIYPTIVLIFAVVSIMVLMTWVLPAFRPMFDDAGTSLPVLTQIVVAVSDFVAAYWWIMAVLLLVGILILQAHNRTEAGRLRWDAWLLRLPLFGDLIRKVEVARFSRTLGTLMSNGVTVLNAMAMTTETVVNKVIVQAVTEVRGRLAKGEGLAQPLNDTGEFPHLAIQLIKVGDESGQLEQMLLRVADIYDDEVTRTIQRILSLLVPVITIALGILIAVIIASIVMAMLSAYEFNF